MPRVKRRKVHPGPAFPSLGYDLKRTQVFIACSVMCRYWRETDAHLAELCNILRGQQ